MTPIYMLANAIAPTYWDDRGANFFIPARLFAVSPYLGLKSRNSESTVYIAVGGISIVKIDDSA